MKLFDVHPFLSPNNTADCSVGNSIFPPEFWLRCSSLRVAHPDRSNVRFCKFRAPRTLPLRMTFRMKGKAVLAAPRYLLRIKVRPMIVPTRTAFWLGARSMASARRVEPSCDCMECISLGRGPFKIRRDVVRLVPVEMINDIVSMRRHTEKRNRDNTMQQNVPFPVVVPNVDPKVSMPFLFGRHYERHFSKASAGMQKASNPPAIGDFVLALVAGGGAPLFDGKLTFSHGEPPKQVPVVRLGLGGATPGRAVSIVAKTTLGARL